MSVPLMPPRNPSASDDAFPNRIRWTRDDCARLEEAGVLTDRYELIDGVIINKMGQNRPHANAIIRLNTWLVRVFSGEYVQIQLPVDVTDGDNADNEPQPDGVAMNKPVENFRTANPGPEDVVLVVEVSDSTLRFDQTTKCALYARAGFPEYWIIDVNSRRLICHRSPQADGSYADVTEVGEAETVTCLARPDAPVAVADLLD